MKKTKKAPGRPRLPSSVRRRNNVTITMNDALRAQLEEAAGSNQRSVSKEIESQLAERALIRDLMPSFGRPGVFWLSHLLANVVTFVEKKTGKAWDEDAETGHEVIKAVITALNNYRRVRGGADAVTLGESLGERVGRIAIEEFFQHKEKQS